MKSGQSRSDVELNQKSVLINQPYYIDEQKVRKVSYVSRKRRKK